MNFALKAYKLAMEYGVSKPTLLKKRLKIAKEMTKKFLTSDEIDEHTSFQRARQIQKIRENHQQNTKSKKIQNNEPDHTLSYIILGTIVFAGLFGAMFFCED